METVVHGYKISNKDDFPMKFTSLAYIFHDSTTSKVLKFLNLFQQLGSSKFLLNYSMVWCDCNFWRSDISKIKICRIYFKGDFSFLNKNDNTKKGERRMERIQIKLDVSDQKAHRSNQLSILLVPLQLTTSMHKFHFMVFQND